MSPAVATDTMADIPTLAGSEIHDFKPVDSNPKLIPDESTVVSDGVVQTATPTHPATLALSPIFSATSLTVNRLDLWKFMSFGDPLHQYNLTDESGGFVGYAKEKEKKKLARVFKGGDRGYTIEVFDATNTVVMTVTKVGNGLVDVHVTDSTGHLTKVGRAKKVWQMLKRNFALLCEGTPFGLITTKNTSDVYPVFNPETGALLAKITAEPTDRFFSNEVTYTVLWEPTLADIARRAVVLACMLAIDFEYYTSKD